MNQEVERVYVNDLEITHLVAGNLKDPASPKSISFTEPSFHAVIAIEGSRDSFVSSPGALALKCTATRTTSPWNRVRSGVKMGWLNVKPDKLVFPVGWYRRKYRTRERGRLRRAVQSLDGSLSLDTNQCGYLRPIDRLRVHPILNLERFSFRKLVKQQKHCLVPPFLIRLNFISPVSRGIRFAFEQAVAKWQTVVKSDQGGRICLRRGQRICKEPFYNPVGFRVRNKRLCVNTLLVLVGIRRLDGIGNTLGAAGTCIHHSRTQQPKVGMMVFDQDDFTSLEAKGLLTQVVTHELGHS